MKKVKKRLIFLIEDSELVQNVVKHILRDIPNIEIKTFFKIENALNKISENPDIFIVDNHLEGLDGVSGIPVIREFSPKAKIILLSSQDDVDLLAKSLSYGADIFLSKKAEDLIRLKNYISKSLVEEKKSWWSGLATFWKKDKKRIKNIFVLDDNELTSFSIDYTLSHHNVGRVRSFNCTEKFIREFAAEDVDLVILDYMLEPDVNGLDVLKRIKLLSPDTTVIMLTAQQNIKTAISLLANGASYYFIKSSENIKNLPKVIKAINMEEQFLMN